MVTFFSAIIRESRNERQLPVGKNRQFQFFKNPTRDSHRLEPGFEITKKVCPCK